MGGFLLVSGVNKIKIFYQVDVITEGTLDSIKVYPRATFGDKKFSLNLAEKNLRAAFMSNKLKCIINNEYDK